MSLQEDIQAWDAEAREALAYARSKPWGRGAYLSADMSYIHVPNERSAAVGNGLAVASVPAEMASIRKFKPNA